MREGWEMKKLGEVSKIMYGYTAKSAFDFVGPKYLRITDIQNSKVNWDLVPNCKGLNGEYEKYKLKEGDIVFARTGATTGKSFLIEDLPSAVFASYLIRVQLNSNVLLPNFIYHFFQSSIYWKIIEKGITGSAQGGFNASKLSGLSIPIPPLSEQHQIVSILDKTFAAIYEAKANIEKNLNNAKELFQSQLNKIFSEKGEGWVEKKLGECFRLKSGEMMTAKMMSNNGKFPVYGGNGIAGYHDKYNLSGNNVIVGRVGALCGNVRFITDKIWLTDNAFQLTDFNFDFDNAFLTFLLNFKNLRSMARQAAQPVISNSSLKDIELQFPKSIKVQQNIISQLNALSSETKKLEALYQQKLVELEDLKKSILEKAFKGELTEKELAV